MKKQLRNFVFTCNNWDQSHIDMITAMPLSLGCIYYIYGEETGGEKSTPHLQGYVELESRVLFTKVTKHLCGFHLEPRLGSQSQAIEYCKKQGTYHEHGVPKLQGSRTDIHRLKSVLEHDCSMANLLANDSLELNFQTFRFAERLVKYYDKPRFSKPKVIWFYGASGVGKTRKALELLPNAYFKSNATGKWWLNYDGQEDIIIDDVRPEYYTYVYLLGMLDRYPFQVEDKNVIRQFQGKRIILTSPVDPWVAYKYISGEDINQLIRRLDLIEHIE